MARGWRRVGAAWTAARIARVLWVAATAPVFSATALASGLAWAVLPGVATRWLWRRAGTPGTELHAAREATLVRVARRARRWGV